MFSKEFKGMVAEKKIGVTWNTYSDFINNTCDLFTNTEFSKSTYNSQ